MNRLIITATALLMLCLNAGAQEPEKVDTLREARVTAEKRERDAAATQTGLQRLDPTKINRGFALFNSPDVIKTLQTLPGVAAGTELMSGIFVHGGDGTDNLFLLDGVPIYSVSHFIGLFSSFNNDVVESVDFYKSGFPARYGGRMSSVVDVRTRDGNFNKYHGTFALGLIDGRIQVEGPIIKGKTSFNVGLRRTWSEVVTLPALAIANAYQKREHGDEATNFYGGYNFNDFNARISHKFSEDNRLNLNVYAGDDNMPVRVKIKDKTTSSDGIVHMEESSVKGNVLWGNILTSLNWQNDVSDKLWFDATAYYSRNLSNIGIGLSQQEWNGSSYDNLSVDEKVRSNIIVGGLRADFNWKPSDAHHVRFGGIAQFNDYRPGRDYNVDIQAFNPPLKLNETHEVHFQTGEASLYGEDEIAFTPWLKANLGVRGALYFANGRNYFRAEPRASFKVQCAPSTSIRFSYTEMNQFDHSIATSYIDLPTNTWMPSTPKIKPMFSRQFAGGVYSTLAKGLKLTAEGWYKTMENLYEYGGPTMLYPPIDSWETDFVEGRGKSWGGEFGLEYENDKWNVTAYYTLTWSLRKFEDFYYDWYPDRNDNRHKFDLMVNYSFTPKFEVYGGWHYHTGGHLTAASYRLDVESVYNNDLMIYDRPNSLQLPDYHRLDLGLNWHRITKRGNQSTLNLSIYNAYCRMNPFFAYVDEEEIEKEGPYGTTYERTGRYVGHAIGIVPIIPTLGYTLKF